MPEPHPPQPLSISPDPASVRENAPETNPETDHEANLESRPVDEAGTEATGFLPAEPDRLRFESVFVRLIATAGIIGVGTAVGAILSANDVAGWVVSLVVSALSVVLAAVLWRSRQL